jgi:hypothetical protein
LHNAAYRGHTVVASYLVEMGTKVDVRNRVGGYVSARVSVKVVLVCYADATVSTAELF